MGGRGGGGVGDVYLLSVGSNLSWWSLNTWQSLCEHKKAGLLISINNQTGNNTYNRRQ